MISDVQADSVNNGVIGVLNANGAFRPLATAPIADPAANAAAVTTSGVITATYSFVVFGDVPASATIMCGLNASVVGPDIFLESSSAPATRTGSSATCTVKIAYSWKLTAAGNDVLGLQGDVTAIDSTAGGRTSTFSLGSMAVPANGAQTTIHYNSYL